MIDIQKALSEEIYHKKLNTSILQTGPPKNDKLSNQVEMLILGLEKDRTIYTELFLAYQFIQVKKQKQPHSQNFELWVGLDQSKGDLVQICLCLRGRVDVLLKDVIRGDGWRAEFIKTSASSRLTCKGPSIALIGADGSGKSTVTTELEKWLSKKLDCRRYYLGSGDHYNPVDKRIIKRMIGTINYSRSLNKHHTFNSGKNEQNQTQKHNQKKHLRNCFSYINAFYLYRISVHSLKQLKKSNRFAERGGICLFDRYPQNQFSGINDGPKIRKSYGYVKSLIINRLMHWEEENIKRCVKIGPELVIKLIISPEVAIRRKPDHDILELEKKADIVSQLSFENAVVHNVDANQKYEEELKVIKKLIWDYLFQLSKMED